MKLWFALIFITLPALASNDALLNLLKEHHEISESAVSKIKNILRENHAIGQGNPKSSEHPLSKEECKKRLGEQSIAELQKPLPPCKKPNMAKIGEADGKNICIDRFEFPNVACEYPVVWARASDAAAICEAVGKRLCDASEWESACAGETLKDRYVYSDKKQTSADAHDKERHELNKSRKRIWSYGPKEAQTKCATGSQKSPGCDQALTSGKGIYEACGSNTYPSGSFPECKSSFGVYDLHGNAAEHMNLPLFSEQELTRNGGTGYTEMKGSWFVFQKNRAHADDCYWRAPFWHGAKIASPKSHANYHLGFRCCSSE